MSGNTGMLKMLLVSNKTEARSVNLQISCNYMPSLSSKPVSANRVAYMGTYFDTTEIFKPIVREER